MSETLIFVVLVAVGSLGLIIGLLPLFWSTRETPASIWAFPAFPSTRVMQYYPAVRVKRVPAPVPVKVTRVWLEARQP